MLAKAPVAGRVKTRLGADVGMAYAAELAAAALLDSLDACADGFGPSGAGCPCPATSRGPSGRTS